MIYCFTALYLKIELYHLTQTFFVTPAYLCPGAAKPHGRWYTRTSVTGLHLCWFFCNTVPWSFTLSDPSSGQTHHFSLLHPWATLCWTLKPQSGRSCWRLQLSACLLHFFRVCVFLTVLDQSLKYQFVTQGPMLHSSLPCGRSLVLHSFSFTSLPWSLTQCTLLVLLPIPQSTEHCGKWR